MKNRYSWPFWAFQYRASGTSIALLPGSPWGQWTSRREQIATGEASTQLHRTIDILAASLGLLFMLPFMAIIALRVKLSSKGSIFFIQERIGQDGKPFRMYKFRTMHLRAEHNGPALATENDPRITSYGRKIRKSRMDELPQLWNVLKGDMTLVGPRPERQYYIDRITDHAPNYKRLLQLKPGLTSMGIVHFGYASSVSEMIERQRHDQYYFENRSIQLDLQILAGTVDVIFHRKGR
jgi:polysaccharide biosynthesis protein PslA